MSKRQGYGVKLVRGPFVALPQHHLATDDPDVVARLASESIGPIAADLFCGAGGLSLGLERAGYKVLVGVDHDEDALATHRAHHAGMSSKLDLAEPSVVEELGALLKRIKVDLIAGGPPCQPFSRAGRSAMRDLVQRGSRPAEDMRRGLWQSFLRTVAIAQPAAVLMENVPDMALDHGMWILRSMVDELEGLGYSVHERVVSTSDYGVPQLRQRFFLVALRDGTRFDWPKADERIISVRNAIGDLPPVEGGWRPQNGDDPADRVASGWASYGGPHSSFQHRMRADVPDDQADRIYDHITRPVRQDDAEAFALMDSSTKYSDLPEELKRYRSDIFDDKYKRLSWDNLSRTIVAHIAKDGYWYIHPDQSRTISVREAARIQTFPDDVRFSGPPSAAFKQIGNAVPPEVAFRLATAIRDSLEHPVPGNFRTADVAQQLAGWYETVETGAIPWLRSTNRLQLVVAAGLLDRMSASDARLGWRLIEPLRNCDEMRAARRAIEFGLGPLGRAHRIEVLDAILDELSSSDIQLENATADELKALKSIGPSVADLAVRVHPGESEQREEPIVATSGAIRVASRFFGARVHENRNRLTDGRLAVARLVGGDDNSHAAHLGLIELAESVCMTSAPDCGLCPLVADCSHAALEGYQLRLPATNQALA